ncbi:hypothetical protein [Nostoc sp. CMAA1605]|uniref:hypothetical protein n=1 Tax=Nostoc sp. CMAA1605 TaxID=2055159 RepID=UPI0030D7440D
MSALNTTQYFRNEYGSTEKKFFPHLANIVLCLRDLLGIGDWGLGRQGRKK